MLASTPTYRFFFAVGWVYTSAGELLILGALAGFFLRPAPPVYQRVMTGLAFVFLAVSMVCVYAYAREFVDEIRSTDPYESYAFLRTRVAGPATDLFHWVHPSFPLLPWSPYWWAYYSMIAGVFCPQFFWIPAVRRRSSLTLCFAVAALASRYIEQLVILLHRWSA